jgi:hypothetical protein|tara:strand:- start:111 stop:473 length:363 start_codon:yes stop_codon:yes gene_type:complete
MSDIMSDRLDVLVGKEACPVCGTISQKGNARCPECGTFHSGVHLEEREAPTPEERINARDIDPLDYSINPVSAITDEDFEGDDATLKHWSGGSTDFSFVDENPVSIKKIEIPESEEIESD